MTEENTVAKKVAKKTPVRRATKKTVTKKAVAKKSPVKKAPVKKSVRKAPRKPRVISPTELTSRELFKIEYTIALHEKHITPEGIKEVKGEAQEDKAFVYLDVKTATTGDKLSGSQISRVEKQIASSYANPDLVTVIVIASTRCNKPVIVLS